MYLPTLDKSYLLGSNNRPNNNDFAVSACNGSLGLIFLYISSKASSCVLAGSLYRFSLIKSSSNKSIICWSDWTPSALIKVVIGTFLVLSTLAEYTSWESDSNSIHVPRIGMIVPEYKNLPVLSLCASKYTPGLLTSWEIITLSAPLIKKVPLSVITGKSHKNISCSLISPVSLLNRRTCTCNLEE